MTNLFHQSGAGSLHWFGSMDTK